MFSVVQDKTFGLKNKKGSKQQKFIQHVQHQVTQGGKTAKQVRCVLLLITSDYCSIQQQSTAPQSGHALLTQVRSMCS